MTNNDPKIIPKPRDLTSLVLFSLSKINIKTKGIKAKVIFVTLIVTPKIGKKPKRNKLDVDKFGLPKNLKNKKIIIELIIKEDE